MLLSASGSVAHQFFLALLRVYRSKIKSGYPDAGVKVEWDLNGGYVTGEFSIPISMAVDLQQGKFQVDAADFLEEESP